MNDSFSIKDMWPRPRVGQFVKLKNGKLAEVIIVTRAREVLKLKTELEALLLGPKCQALYGVEWLDIYYEAIVKKAGTTHQFTVTPVDVEEIIDRSQLP